ncbi:CopL family metal-binding regulatory protein [Colwellia sp. Arc7-635]|uniref:CopL family metal-binding regulatory protein n=1 Tax=Colwellia sp. Arc7-635 TaxID=2497879 RepID=UPI001F496A4C|nr:CopL family metal-binding regulatory protein [Colwellia sp. Arc7-635]
MSFNFPKTLMVLLFCLTFVGQALASTVMSYHMVSMKVMTGQVQSDDMAKMGHSGHHMASDSTSKTSEESTDDCCVKNCSCVTGGCSNIVTLLRDTGSNPIIDLSSKISSYISLVQSQQPSSLYRPPILS